MSYLKLFYLNFDIYFKDETLHLFSIYPLTRNDPVLSRIRATVDRTTSKVVNTKYRIMQGFKSMVAPLRPVILRARTGFAAT